MGIFKRAAIFASSVLLLGQMAAGAIIQGLADYPPTTPGNPFYYTTPGIQYALGTGTAFNPAGYDIRDLFGRVGEYFLTPTEWEFDHYHDWRIRLTVQSLDVVQSTPELLREYDAFRVNAIDPYLGVRNAYLAHRAAEIQR